MTIAYLDWYGFFVNDVIGNAYLFLLFFFLLVGIIAARFRFSNMITLMVLVVLGIMFAAFPPFQNLLVILLYVIGSIITYFLTRLIGARG